MISKALSTIIALVLLQGVVTAQHFGDYPPNAIPGKCYAKCFIPAQVRPVHQQVMVSEATTCERIIPATYRTVYDTVITREPSYRMRSIPAVYGTVNEQVLVKPSQTRWVQKRDPNCQGNNCMVMCMVEDPAQYKHVTKRVVRQPARSEQVMVPGEFRLVPRQVVVCDERIEQTVIPARYQTITREEIVQPGGFSQWVEVMCESNLTPYKIGEIQQALKRRGYYFGPIDRIAGTRTRDAMKRFQRDNYLPVGQINLRTLSALGVAY